MKEFFRTLEINQFTTDYVVTAPNFEPLSEFILNERPLDKPEGKLTFEQQHQQPSSLKIVSNS